MHLDRIGSRWAMALAFALAACGGTSPKGPAQWEACRASAAANARVQADVDQGTAFKVLGTPTLVVNGMSYFGPAPSEIEGIVASAIASAAASGIPPASYYQQAVLDANAGDMPVPVGDAPVRGPADAWVTLVEFGDFECPYCRNAEPAIEAVLAAHPDDVRLVYKEFPLPQHDQAMPAALAADCADQQGQFWEMHDLLEKGSLDDGALVGYANQLGLK